MGEEPKSIINTLNEAIESLKAGDKKKARKLLSEVFNSNIAGDYRRLVFSLGFLVDSYDCAYCSDVESNAEEVNELSKKLFGEECVNKDNLVIKGSDKLNKDELLKCMVKVRNWFSEYLREDGGCIYDARAPREFIDACKITAGKIGRFSISPGFYVFAGKDDVGVHRSGVKLVGEITKEGNDFYIHVSSIDEDVMSFTDLNKYFGLPVSDCRMNPREHELVCKLGSKNADDVARELTLAAAIHAASIDKEYPRYVNKLEIERFKELIGGGNA